MKITNRTAYQVIGGGSRGGREGKQNPGGTPRSRLRGYASRSRGEIHTCRERDRPARFLSRALVCMRSKRPPRARLPPPAAASIPLLVYLIRRIPSLIPGSCGRYRFDVVRGRVGACGGSPVSRDTGIFRARIYARFSHLHLDRSSIANKGIKRDRPVNNDPQRLARNREYSLLSLSLPPPCLFPFSAPLARAVSHSFSTTLSLSLSFRFSLSPLLPLGVAKNASKRIDTTTEAVEETSRAGRYRVYPAARRELGIFVPAGSSWFHHAGEAKCKTPTTPGEGRTGWKNSASNTIAGARGNGFVRGRPRRESRPVVSVPAGFPAGCTC